MKFAFAHQIVKSDTDRGGEVPELALEREEPGRGLAGRQGRPCPSR